VVQADHEGQVIVVGRKTFESIGKPLPNRTTLVLTREARVIPGVKTISHLSQIDLDDPALAGRKVFYLRRGTAFTSRHCRCALIYT